MSSTARLSVPFFIAGQAQKEFTHNEALQTIDLLLAAAVEEGPRADPPTAPSVGACYIVGDSPTGDWAGQPRAVAGYTSGGWRFVAPVEGMTAYVKANAVWANYRAGAWEIGQLRGSNVLVGGQQVVGSRATAIASASGGTTIDSEARSVINQILDALRQHGLIDS